MEDLETRFEELRRLFPLAKKWIEWWGAADIQAMLFPARKRLPLDDPPLPGEVSEDEDEVEAPRRRPDLPSTTNGQESMHRVYYRLWCASSFSSFFLLCLHLNATENNQTSKLQ